MLVVTEEQKMLQDAARSFTETRSPVSALRKLRDEKSADGFDHALWKEMAALGWAGVVTGEAHGGLGIGYVGAGLLCEQMGRTLTASPMVSTAVMAASAISRYSSGNTGPWLPSLLAGMAFFALAVDEGRRHDPAATTMKAEPDGDGFRLTGTKSYVVDGHFAHIVFVVARTPGGLTVFAVDRSAIGTDGLRRENLSTIDSRGAARLTFENLRLEGEWTVLGKVDGGQEVLDTMLAGGRAMYAAELVGIAQEVFDRTVHYLKDRKQFGRAIGSFQALQHRAAHLYCEIEMARSAVLAALQALDTSGLTSAEAALAVSVAKAKAGTVARLAVQEAIQMHGGIGVTDEIDLGLFAKRMQVLSELYGNADFHADLVARLRGF